MQEIVIDVRAQELLKNIIASHILTGEPVGSRTLARLSSEGLSPASIRNVMADLEELGLLSHPHTSAGRVPTDKGYRYYVDTLLTESGPTDHDRALIDTSLSKTSGGLAEAMDVIPRLLSRLTDQVGYLVSPPITEAILKHIEFMKLSEQRILAVFVDRSGVLTHRVLEVRESYSQEDLDRAGRYLVAEFSGNSLGEIRSRLVLLMAEEKAAFDRLIKNAATLGTTYLDAESEERRLVLDGTTNIMKYPELTDVGTMRRLFETFEEKHRLVTLLDRCLAQPGVRVVIGSETDDPALGSLSLVVSQYSAGGQSTGSLGILGPTRMEYDRAVAVVGYIARLVSGLLTRPGA